MRLKQASAVARTSPIGNKKQIRRPVAKQLAFVGASSSGFTPAAGPDDARRVESGATEPIDAPNSKFAFRGARFARGLTPRAFACRTEPMCERQTVFAFAKPLHHIASD